MRLDLVRELNKKFDEDRAKTALINAEKAQKYEELQAATAIRNLKTIE